MTTDDKELTDNDDKEDDIQHQTIKCKMKSILKFPDMLDIIKEKVNIINKIWTETYLLFNQFIIKRLSDDKSLNIDYNLIERCSLFVLDNQNSIRTKGQTLKSINKLIDDTNNIKIKNKLIRDKTKLETYFALNDIYQTIYSKLGSNNLQKYNQTKSINRPLEYLSRQIIVNIKNHTSIHFWKFQKRYLKAKLLDKLTDQKLNKRTIHSIINCIQFHINNKGDTIIIKSKYIKKLKEENLDKYNYVIDIIKTTILNERSNLPIEIKNKVNQYNLSRNFQSVLKYYYYMLQFLEKNDKKRFSLLPQLSFGYSYIKFDSRFLSTIYDEWILKKIDEVNNFGEEFIKKKYNITFKLKTVGIKAFEKNYSEYFDRCFKFKEITKKRDIPISFTTNGYSVCILYKNKVDKINHKQSTKKLDLDKWNVSKKFKKGLFDADEIKASDKFLENYHKIGIDPNNNVLLYCYSETGKKMEITKGYFNNISHITLNTQKMKRYIKESNIMDIYKQLSDLNYKKTIDVNKYSEFIKIYRNNSDVIWQFYSQNKVQSLELDTFINKKKALHTIVRKLIPKYKHEIKFNNSQNKHVDNKLYDKVKNKPTLIAFGKGNGKITISNLKNSGPKGPVKTLALELSKYGIVILTDEYNTSKTCSECENPLEHPKVKKTITKKFKGENGDKINKQVDIICENYSLCHCKNGIHQTDKSVSDVHKIWNRDYNASKNILKVMSKKLAGSKLGIYTRKKLKKIEATDITINWSYDQSDPNKCDSEKKVSLTKTLVQKVNKPVIKSNSKLKPVKAKITNNLKKMAMKKKIIIID